MPSVYIFYGFNEGPAHAWQLRRALAQAGFRLTANLDEADVVITHSGGCFLLPNNLAGKIVIIVNPVCSSLWQLPWILSRKVWGDFISCWQNRKRRAWARKTAWNAIYMFSRVSWHLCMLRRIKDFRFVLPTVHAAKVVIINNQLDPWARLLPAAEIRRHTTYNFVTFPGHHDDLWLNPQIYTAVVQSLYGA